MFNLQKCTSRKKETDERKGFSLIETICVIAIIAILVAVLAPSLLQHVEQSRAKKDMATVDEIVNTIQLAIGTPEGYNELMGEVENDNVSCYVDSADEESYTKTVTKDAGDTKANYAFGDEARLADESEFYAAGNMRGVTITFEPKSGSDSGNTYNIKDAVVNKYENNKGVKLEDLEYVYNYVRATVGEKVTIESQTYRNSDYTVYVNANTGGAINAAAQEAIEVYGQFNGTNLSQPSSTVKVTTNRNDGNVAVPSPSEPDSTPPSGGSVACKHATTRIDNKVDATCLEGGYSGDVVCANCNITIAKGVNVPAGGHSWVIDVAIEADCTTTGLTDGSRCEHCGEILKAQETVNALGHIDENLDYACDRCGTEAVTYAVYSADDNSLSFYRDLNEIVAGEAYRTKTATDVYIVPETTNYSNSAKAPWSANHANDIKSVDVVDKITPNNKISFWFYGLTSCESMNLNNMDTSNVTTMIYAFDGCSALKTLDLTGWNTVNVIDMYYMFNDCSALTTLNLTNWNTKNVKTLTWMFANCTQLKTISGLESWDTGNVRSMNYVFYNCSALEALNLSGWDTKSSTTMGYMFANCSSLKTIGNLDGWVVNGVTAMDRMFMNCGVLTSVGDFSSWETESLNNIAYMFYKCSSLTTLNMSGWDTDQVTSMQSVFSGCSNLTTVGDLSSWNAKNVTTAETMFNGCKALVSLNLSGLGMDAVTSVNRMFYDCQALTTVGDLSGWTPNNLKYMYAMFYKCHVLNNVGDFSDWNTENVQNMGRIFFNCNALEKLDLSGWKVDNATDINHMFYGCSALETVGDISGWATNNVSNMSAVFRECRALTSLDLSGWDTSSATNMSYMFYQCAQLTDIDLSGWSTASATDMSNMFRECEELTTIYVSEDWTVENVTTHSLMFCNCNNLVGGNGTTFNSSYQDKTYAHIDEEGNPGYLSSKI